MKRLKRLLAMGLTLTMALSLMAGAAFTDTEQLKTAEAVDMLTALNIIQGLSRRYLPPGRRRNPRRVCQDALRAAQRRCG